MNFVIDAQLPPALARWISNRSHHATHVFDIGLHAADDPVIWERARKENAVIISKDEDFVDRSLQSDTPVVLIWVRKGNCSESPAEAGRHQSRRAPRWLHGRAAQPGLFVLMYVRKEAVLSSQIEGTQASLMDVLEFEAQALEPGRPKDMVDAGRPRSASVRLHLPELRLSSSREGRVRRERVAP